MIDDFLYQARPEIPPELAGTILARLNRLSKEPAAVRWYTLAAHSMAKFAAQHKLLATLIVLTLLAACGVGITRIGKLALREVLEYPQETEAVASPVLQRLIPLSEALEDVSFEFRLPAWIPEGYQLREQALVTLPGPNTDVSEAWQVWLYWQKVTAAGVQEVLFLAYPSKYEAGVPVPVGSGSVEAVEIDGNPAALIRGNWLGSRWEETLGGSLRWVDGETAYWLTSAWVSPDDLLKMAESLR